jgi:GR25 family glycosyltransferase involved in LPS biosynthesis
MKYLSRLPFLFFATGHTEAAILLQRLLSSFNPKLERLRALNFFRNGAQLRSMRWGGRQEYPVYVINREKDVDRLQQFKKSCAKWAVDFKRVEGVDLRSKPVFLGEYRNRIADLCYNKLEFVKGIYGCFLGHREAWKAVAKGASKWGLVCEDDASFLGPIPKSIEQFTLPENAEIVFCNQRMSDGLLLRENSKVNRAQGFEYVTADEGLEKLLEFTPHIIAPGGDAYLLSRSGAQKLLKIFEETRMAFDVDWFMLFHSISNKAMDLFLQTDRTGRFDGYVPHRERLSGYVLVPSLVEQAEGESKVRRREFCSREEMFMVAVR